MEIEKQKVYCKHCKYYNIKPVVGSLWDSVIVELTCNWYDDDKFAIIKDITNKCVKYRRKWYKFWI